MIKKILLPLDGSEFGEKSLPYAVELGQALKAQLLLVWVLHPQIIMSEFGAVTYQSLVSMEETEAREYLSGVQKDLQKRGLSAETRIIDGPVADAILDLATKEEIDLIVMSTHGRSGLSRWVYGSVANKVLQHAPCPVFLVRVKR